MASTSKKALSVALFALASLVAVLPLWKSQKLTVSFSQSRLEEWSLKTQLKRQTNNKKVAIVNLDNAGYNQPSFRPVVTHWKRSKILPEWMKEYLDWHIASLADIAAKEDNWKNYKYLVVRCLNKDPKCGGTADRLKPLPYYLVAAHRLKRLLFFHWEKPAALHEFLVPVEGSMNWTWPPASPSPSLAKFSFPMMPHRTYDDVDQKLGLYPLRLGHVRFKPFKQIATIRIQSHFHGLNQYNELRYNNATEPSYDEVFRECWHNIFQPSPPVQQRIDQHMTELQLKPNEYHAIHLRSQYHAKLTTPSALLLVQNAVHCLGQLVHDTKHRFGKSTPMFVASDTKLAARMAVEYARSVKGMARVTTIVGEKNSKNGSSLKDDQENPTLHLDRGTRHLDRGPKEWTIHEAHEYYDTFVDLYILSQAKCIVYNVGNFGKWANLMSSDHTCEHSHMKDKACKWPKLDDN